MNTVDVLISFDTTGSMYPCLTQVRREVKDLVNKLFSDIPRIRIGILAHGDYCDERHPYVTKMLDLTSDQAKIIKFVTDVEPTGGGDAPECYELVLNMARSAKWESGISKIFVMIGDDVPHPASYPENKGKLDWKNEAGLLHEAGIHVYAVQALGRTHATSFYEKLAGLTDGYHLELDQFSDIRELIMAVCYKQEGDARLESYEADLVARRRINRNLDNVIGVLLGRKKSTRFKTSRSSLGAVPNGRFQVIDVGPKPRSIRDFVQDQGLKFEKGRGFYEFVKRDKKTKIQDYKEVILMDNTTGDLFSGDKARELAGIPIGRTVDMQPTGVDGYTVFIQSTSVNRALQPDTRFLYEVDGWRD